ncbi:hypothetical protein B1B04_05355 [Lysinibacillus sp. KCTC 33748]|uniref:hypothetical protein n=1 Tax=unclassified Lysinibacillus TaxID=2636778 RepID=UPI0009A8A000|nr:MULTISPECIES: hypothetical protein [unclassified Lysinibacillus]OXS76401.1 hypothetical protein B1B04_05355 [Lysinibacillus sp. KCTC 33748]SKB45389.1 hypothetical protein SAMN06295926_102555 [Lysinibacillus sp. AC-3]
MTVTDKRNLFFSGPKEEMESLQNDLKPWKLSTTTSQGFKYVLSKDDIEIYLTKYHDCDDFLIMYTRAILPQDSKDTPIPINEDILFDLYKVINNQIEQNFGYVMISITLSESDLNI